MKVIAGIDTETTDLLKPIGTPLNLQPHIIEIYAAQINLTTNEIIREVDTLIKPPVPILEHITKINGITNDMVKDAPLFVEVFPEIVKVFFGAWEIFGANVSFDEGILITEFQRLGKEHHFPYSPQKFCIIEQSMHIKGYRMKNSELYKMATGKEIVGIHRAKADLMATYEVYKWLKKR